MTTVPITIIPLTDQRVTMPAGLNGLIVRLGLAISSWGANRSKRIPTRVNIDAELMRERLSADLIYYRMR